MRWGSLLVISVLLVGCQEPSIIDDEAVDLQQMSTIKQSKISYAILENEITYIEMLIGTEQMESARLALNDLLFSMNGELMNEFQQSRINTLIMLLEEEDLEDLVDHHHFTGEDAAAIAMVHYGDDDDIVFMYHEQPSHFGSNQIGYYVALKSISLLESNGESDGIVLTLFISEDGSVVEVE